MSAFAAASRAPVEKYKYQPKSGFIPSKIEGPASFFKSATIAFEENDVNKIGWLLALFLLLPYSA